MIDFAQLAIDNLGLSDQVLASVGQPLKVKRTVLAGRRTPLDAFAVAVVGDDLADVRLRPARVRACSRSSARSTRSGGSCAGSSRGRALLAEKVGAGGRVLVRW